jgi:membrane-associated phospholipid phosphatase
LLSLVAAAFAAPAARAQPTTPTAAPAAPASPAAEATPSAAPAPPRAAPTELPYSLAVDATITGVAIAGWLGSEALKGELAPSTCRWCDPPGFDSSVRDALHWQETGRADVLSYVVPLAVEPAVVFGLNAYSARDQAPPRAGWVDALLVSEATAIAMAMNQAVKFVVGRERPFVHALPEAEKPNTSRPSDNNVSFYSGHASLAFAMATSGGTIASMRGYRLAPWVWGLGLSLAAATAYLRIAADRHYLSDVTVGAVVGGLTGLAVPYLFHNPHRARRVGLAPGPVEHGGAGLAVRGVF